MVGIAGAKFLALNPKVGQLFELGGQHYQGHTNHHHDEQLRGPSLRLEVAIANGGESDHNKVDALEDWDKVAPTAPLGVLEAAGTGSSFDRRRIESLEIHVSEIISKMVPISKSDS